MKGLFRRVQIKDKFRIDDEEINALSYTIEHLSARIQEKINELTRTNLYDLNLDEESFQRELKKRSTLKRALRQCTYGSVEEKAYVKDFIKDLMNKEKDELLKNQTIIRFRQPHLLTVQDKFDMLLYAYKEQYQGDALSALITKHELDKLRIHEGIEAEGIYRITEEDIEKAFEYEGRYFDEADQMALIVQRIYQHYKGFGVVDEIRDMNIDGVSGGVSGLVEGSVQLLSPKDMVNQIHLPQHYESVWIYYKGKTIHLAFLSFGSEKELRRVCQNIYRYNKAGQLSENVGYKVNDMKDGSRVVVVRPQFSESWAFFVRKFHIKNVTLEELIQDEGCEILIALLSYLVKGARIMAITGAQGTGKTTLLMALVREIYPTLTLRVQEMAFELHLRKVYPYRNILTFKETSTISGQAGLDLQKKTDGAVNILGEVATDPVASWLVQMAMVASLFTLFTHHAKTTSDLVLSLRNSLLKCDVFRDERIAQEQVVNVIDFDIHLEKDMQGKRYISRITEIVPADASEQVQYNANDILVYEEGRYKMKRLISEKTASHMCEMMSLKDRVGFRGFMDAHGSRGG